MIRSGVLLAFLAVWVCPVAVADERPDAYAAIKKTFLSGKIDEAKSLGEARIAAEPRDAAARALVAQCLMRVGNYDEADKVLANAPVADGLIVVAAMGELREAQARPDEARATRTKAIALLQRGKDFSLDELVAGSMALRGLGEFKAANQCLQLAQDKDAKDPFLQLEKIRLYAATHSEAIASQTAKSLAAAHPDCAMAYAEWAEALWRVRQDKDAVLTLCARAIELDATMLGARCRTAYYYLLGDEPAMARVMIEENLRINPNHRDSLLLNRAIDALHFDASNPNPKNTDADFNLLMADLLAAKGRHQWSLVRARAALEAMPGDVRGLRQAGMAEFRMGKLAEARPLLEQASAQDAYDIEVRNALTLLDAIGASKSLNSGALTIAFDPRDALTSLYATELAAQAYDAQLRSFALDGGPPLRIQFVGARDDLAVVTQGIPFGCCADPADPATSGVVSFENVAFLWSPVAKGGLPVSYRWDAALHRATGQAAVRAASANQAPQWLREGFAGYAAMRNVRDYTPPVLTTTLSKLSGTEFALGGMESGFLGPKRPLFDMYASLLAEDWTLRYGQDTVNTLWKNLASGKEWLDALEETFGVPLEKLKRDSDAEILKRYAWVGGGAESKQASADAQSAIEAGDAEGAAKHALDALNASPLDYTNLGLYRRIAEALRLAAPRPEIYFSLAAKSCRLDPSNAELRYELAEHFLQVNRPDEAIEWCRDALGIRPGWLEAHRLLAGLALDQDRMSVAYASLLVLHEARPRHVKTLQDLARCAKVLGRAEAATYAEQLQKLSSGDSSDTAGNAPASGS